MLENLALRITSYMIGQGVVPKEDEEIYVFGWTMLLFSVGSFSAILLAGALLKQFLGTVLFLLFFTFLRSYAGGWHANSFFHCFLITSSLYASCTLFHFYLPEAYWSLAIYVLLALSLLITFIWAPVDHPNKPFRGGQKEKNKKLARITVLAQTLIIIVLGLWQPVLLNTYLLWAALGMAVTSLTLLFLICHPYKTTEKAS